MKTRTYRMDHDLGFAPNPFFGWCTLACCKPNVRKAAKKGDIIVGMAGKSGGLKKIYPRLIFWMRVDDAMPFDDYWRDLRFVPKRPQIPGPRRRAVGDRTYRHEEGHEGWLFERSMHYRPTADQVDVGHVSADTQVDRMLIGKDFTYWGSVGPKVPDHLIALFKNRDQDGHEGGPLLTELHELIDIEHPKGLVGDPADWDNPRYFAAA
ncbi:MAG TPA: hypothetical protein VF655_01505 [Allosphingosinicella sp.]|jgi:hypothetical protein